MELFLILLLNARNNEPFLVIVTDTSESNVTLDANHSLAGKDLTFKIELVEIL